MERSQLNNWKELSLELPLTALEKTVGRACFGGWRSALSFGKVKFEVSGDFKIDSWMYKSEAQESGPAWR